MATHLFILVEQQLFSLYQHHLDSFLCGKLLAFDQARRKSCGRPQSLACVFSLITCFCARSLHSSTALAVTGRTSFLTHVY